MNRRNFIKATLGFLALSLAIKPEVKESREDIKNKIKLMIKESMMEMRRDIDKQIYYSSTGLGKSEKLNPFINSLYSKENW